MLQLLYKNYFKNFVLCICLVFIAVNFLNHEKNVVLYTQHCATVFQPEDTYEVKEVINSDDGKSLRLTELRTNCAWQGDLQTNDSPMEGEMISLSSQTKLVKPSDEYMEYLFSSGYAGQLQINAWEKVGSGYGFVNHITAVKTRLQTIVAEKYGRKNAALILGLSIGDGSLFTKAEKDVFSGVGVSHLLAVSGANFTLVLVIFSCLINKMFPSMHVRISYVVLFFAGLGYLTLVGFMNFPALRAFSFLSISYLQKLSGRKLQKIFTCVLGMAFILLVFPFSYASISLQLSLLAWMLISYLLKGMLSRIDLSGAASELLSAVFGTLLLLPVSLHYFGKVNLLSVFYNGALVPIFGLVNIFSLFLVALSYLGDWIGVSMPILNSMLANFTDMALGTVFRVMDLFSAYSIDLVVDNHGGIVIALFMPVLVSKLLKDLGYAKQRRELQRYYF